MNVYSFEQLRKSFPRMTNQNIRNEYASVLNRIKQIYKANISEKTKSRYLEPLEDARLFLEGYLAQLSLSNCGFYQRSDGEWCHDDHRGRDYLH